MTVFNPLITIVPANSPYKTVHDLIADAKKNPENFTWDSLGGVSGDDFVGRMIMNAAKIDMAKTKPVMSKGGAEAAVLVAGGNIKMGNPASISALPHIQAGTVRALAVALKERDPLLPDVPTYAELGFPSVYCPFWLGRGNDERPRVPGADQETAVQAFLSWPQRDGRIHQERSGICTGRLRGAEIRILTTAFAQSDDAT